MLDSLNSFSKKYKDLIDALLKPIIVLFMAGGVAYVTLWLQVNYVTSTVFKETQVVQIAQNKQINEKLDLLLQDKVANKEKVDNMVATLTDVKERVLYLERQKGAKNTP